MKEKIRLVFLVLLTAVIFMDLEAGDWQEIEKGLEWRVFGLEEQSGYSKAEVEVIRINPQLYDFEFLLGSQHAGACITIEDWAEQYKFLAAVNAGMYQADYLSSSGYLVNYDHENNSYMHPEYKMYFVFNPRQEGLVEAQAVDRDEAGYELVIGSYHSILQCIRLVAQGGRNVWQKPDTAWPEAALGEDRAGNILIVFCRTAYPVASLVDQLLKFPLGVDKLMHLEGSSPASLYLEYKDTRILRSGIGENLEPGVNSSSFKPIPNLITVRRNF